MPRNTTFRNPLWIGALLAAAIAVGIVAVLRIDLSGDQGNKLPPGAVYDIQEYMKIDPALVRYRQTGTIRLDLREPRAITVGRDDRIYVAGDQAILVFDPGGTKRASLSLDGQAQCLAVDTLDPAGQIFAGMEKHVEVYDAQGNRVASWADASPRSVFTAIALGDQDVFVADAGQKVILRYDRTGKLLRELGRRDPKRHIPALLIPSPYFDLVMAPDGLLRVVNPGAHTIEPFTVDGDLELPLVWGEPSMTAQPRIAGFCGCCNPAHLAILPDGRYVTAEKGIPIVKIYDADGKFECVVAGPDVLAPTPTASEETRTDYRLRAVDVAADSRSRVLVLDPAARSVRIFEPKQN